jgi:hypothetical protein
LKSSKIQEGERMTEKAEIVSFPCPFMVFQRDHYHTCKLFPEQPWCLESSDFCLCSGIAKGLPVSDRSRILDCPRGFTIVQIEAKIKALESWVKLKLASEEMLKNE